MEDTETKHVAEKDSGRLQEGATIQYDPERINGPEQAKKAGAENYPGKTQ